MVTDLTPADIANIRNLARNVATLADAARALREATAPLSYTPKTAEAATGIPEKAISNACRDGLIKAKHKHNRWIIPRHSLAAYVGELELK